MPCGEPIVFLLRCVARSHACLLLRADRATLCGLSICDALCELDLRPSVGITTGAAFCGVVGSRGRREYSVLGDSVNLSARLMQHSTKTGAKVTRPHGNSPVVNIYLTRHLC